MPVPPGSFTQLPPNSTGPKLATGPTYTENANVVQDEKVLLGEQYLSSYLITTSAANVSIATAASHTLQIMSGASLKVRVRRITIFQVSAATTVATALFQLVRLSTAGTGGTAITPAPLDTADAASGATAMTLPTVKGTETTQLYQAEFYCFQTLATGTPLIHPGLDLNFDLLHVPPIIIPAGAANGLALKMVDAVAAGTVRVNVWITESAF